MGLYPACSLPWIDTAVNKYVDNIPPLGSIIETYMCCLTPGDCTTNPVQGTCPLGYLDCTLGNTRYACKFSPSAGQGPSCYSEGTLTHTRNLPCCQSNLVDYLKTQTCTGGFGTVGNASYCCTDKSVDSCSTRIGCPGLTADGHRPYYCKGGVTGSICTGYGDSYSEKCVTEIGLVQEVSESCMSMTFPSTGCVLGGSGPALPPPGSITTSAVTTTRPSTTTGAPTPTGPIELPKSAGSKNVAKKWLALCMVAPALLQMVFL
ncbi:hypothetical protein BG005_000235 [Podila minutissima]|nr:hypothetical protein BG005_000235 [Podila minutissima]